jgi:hypothetical protein
MKGYRTATSPCKPRIHDRRRWRLSLGLVLVLMAANGCDRPPESPSELPPIAESDAILRRMIDTYRQARTYADQGIVRLRYRSEGQWIEDQASLMVRLERPNRLIVRVYQLTIVCDGERWQTQITDPQTSDLDGQVLIRAAPDEMTLEEIYQDPLVKDVIAGGLAGPPVTLELLLDQQPLGHLLAPDVRRELLADKPIASRVCRRVRVTLPEGCVVFWVDRETHLLRRLEYPTDRLAQQLDPEGRMEDFSLVADFRESSVDVDLDRESFTVQPGADAKIVNRFVLPPRPLPSDLLGRLPGDFHFVDLDSNRWTREALLGQTAVLAWFNVHPASELCMRQLAEVRRGTATDEPVTFLAVCTEPTTVGNRELARLAEDWNLAMPVVRDLEAFGRDIFQIPGAPTVIVLDPRGVVQAVAVGANPSLGESLPDVLRQVLSGQDLAGPLVAHFQQQQDAYHQALLEVIQRE